MEWYFNSPLVFGKNNAEAAAFVKNHRERYKQPPSTRSAFGYITANRMMQAIEEAKGTDAVAVCKAIAGRRFDALCNSPAYYRDVDHQLIWPMWFGRIRPEGANGDPYDIWEVIDAQPGDKIAQAADEQQRVCKIAFT
jgi:hypothetical protein